MGALLIGGGLPTSDRTRRTPVNDSCIGCQFETECRADEAEIEAFEAPEFEQIDEGEGLSPEMKKMLDEIFGDHTEEEQNDPEVQGIERLLGWAMQNPSQFPVVKALMNFAPTMIKALSEDFEGAGMLQIGGDLLMEVSEQITGPEDLPGWSKLAIAELGVIHLIKMIQSNGIDLEYKG